jgi:hypothetical protein
MIMRKKDHSKKKLLLPGRRRFRLKMRRKLKMKNRRRNKRMKLSMRLLKNKK